MLSLAKFTSSQIEALQYLYDNPGLKTMDNIKRHCHNFNHTDFLALCSAEYGNVIKRITPWSGELFEITPAGRAVIEAIQKQTADEAYHRNYNNETLKAAQEANTHAKKSNILAIISIVVSVLAFALSLISLIRG